MTDSAESRLLDTVNAFYRAENNRDWDRVAARVSEDIDALTYPGGKRVKGKDAYLAGMADMYQGRDATFDVLSISADPHANVVHAELVIEQKRSVNVFEIRDGLIVAEREYLGEGYTDR